jgi:hypothetical protein
MPKRRQITTLEAARLANEKRARLSLLPSESEDKQLDEPVICRITKRSFLGRRSDSAPAKIGRDRATVRQSLLPSQPSNLPRTCLKCNTKPPTARHILKSGGSAPMGKRP